MEPELQEFYRRKLAKYRAIGDNLENERKRQRSEIWESWMSGPEAMIPGLPDQVVEFMIWPKVCRYLEDVRTVRVRGSEMIDRIETVRALEHTSRKWRHVVQHSKPGGAFRYLLEEYEPKDWEMYPSTLKSEYWKLMSKLPPLDVFYKSERYYFCEFVRNWIFLSADRAHRDMYLTLYPDPLDASGRLRRWKEWRDDPLCGCRVL